MKKFIALMSLAAVTAYGAPGLVVDKEEGLVSVPNVVTETNLSAALDLKADLDGSNVADYPQTIAASGFPTVYTEFNQTYQYAGIINDRPYFEAVVPFDGTYTLKFDEPSRLPVAGNVWFIHWSSSQLVGLEDETGSTDYSSPLPPKTEWVDGGELSYTVPAEDFRDAISAVSDTELNVASNSLVSAISLKQDAATAATDAELAAEVSTLNDSIDLKANRDGSNLATNFAENAGLVTQDSLVNLTNYAYGVIGLATGSTVTATATLADTWYQMQGATLQVSENMTLTDSNVTCQVAGWYSLDLAVGISDNTQPGAQVDLRITTNGTEVAGTYLPRDVSENTKGVTAANALIYLESNDVVAVEFRSDGAGDEITFTGGALVVAKQGGGVVELDQTIVDDASSIPSGAAVTDSLAAKQDVATLASTLLVSSTNSFTTNVHFAVIGQSFAVGSVEDSSGDLAGPYLTGMTNCWENAYTRAATTGATVQDTTGQMRINLASSWSAQISAAAAFRDALGINIYCTRTGMGGVQLTQYYPGSTWGLWEDFTNEVEVTKSTYGVGDPESILLLQGQAETASAAGSADYYNRLTNVFTRVHALYPNAKVYIYGENYYYATNATYFAEVQAAKRQFCSERDWAFYIDGLEDSYGDNHHADSVGNLQMGLKFAQAHLGTDSLPPDVKAFGNIDVIGKGTVSELEVYGDLTVDGVIYNDGASVMQSQLRIPLYVPFESYTPVDAVGTNTLTENGDVDVVYDSSRYGGVWTNGPASTNYLGLSEAFAGKTNQTFSFWAKVNEATNLAHYVCGKAGTTGSLTINLIPAPLSQRVYVRYNSGVNDTYAMNPSYVNDVPTGVDVDMTSWHHYVFVTSNGTGRLYFDGALADINDSDLSTAPKASTTFDRLGAGAYGGATPTPGGLRGRLDEFLVIDAALSASEVLSLYNAQRLGDSGVR